MLQKILNTIYSVGAAVVIYGALRKITHQNYANLFLNIGLLTEVIVFLIFAAQEWFTKPQKQITATNSEFPASDNKELTSTLSQLNETIKKVFNQ